MAQYSCSVSTLKAKANALMKCGKYVEAIMEYSEGIALQPANPLLYSNRSLAFLKLEQYFFAMKDAETTIRLVPDWAKGYYRKGQAELGADMFDLAMTSIGAGLRACPCDDMLMKAMDDAKTKQTKYLSAKRKTVRRYVICFSFLGLLLILVDLIWRRNRAILSKSWIPGLIISICGLVGYFIGSMVVSKQRRRKAALLNPPPGLLTGTTLDYLPSKSDCCDQSNCTLNSAINNVK